MKNLLNVPKKSPLQMASMKTPLFISVRDVNRAISYSLTIDSITPSLILRRSEYGLHTTPRQSRQPLVLSTHSDSATFPLDSLRLSDWRSRLTGYNR